MIPIRVERPGAHPPIAVGILIALNALSWLWVQGMGTYPPLAESMCHFALIPGELIGVADAGAEVAVGPHYICRLGGDGRAFTLVTSMFMHGGWLHLIGNMWFLWIFGSGIEDVMGRARFIAFYLLCGLVAAATQIATAPGSMVPMVGASGAIGGVMGGYARLFPRARVELLVLLIFIVTTISVPAIFMLGYWLLLQLLLGLPTLGSDSGGTAFFAHVGGFLAGMALVGWFVREDRLAGQARRSAGTSDRRWF